MESEEGLTLADKLSAVTAPCVCPSDIRLARTLIKASRHCFLSLRIPPLSGSVGLFLPGGDPGEVVVPTASLRKRSGESLEGTHMNRLLNDSKFFTKKIGQKAFGDPLYRLERDMWRAT